MKKLITTLVVLAVLLIVFLMLGPFYILEEGEQAIVTRFGKIDYNDYSLNTQTPLKSLPLLHLLFLHKKLYTLNV